jgi:uncharacterized coiled-coil DUF342 family protein
MDKKKVKEIEDKLNNKFNRIQWYLGKFDDVVDEIEYVKEMIEELAYEIQEELEEVKNG